MNSCGPPPGPVYEPLEMATSATSSSRFKEAIGKTSISWFLVHVAGMLS